MGRTNTSGRNAGNDKKRFDAQEWRARAAKLRYQGFTISEIALRVERSPTAVKTALDEQRKAVPVEDVEARRDQQDRRIQRFMRLWSKTAVHDKDALEAVIKLMGREAKLLGLDAPEKHETTVTVTDDQLRDRLAALALAATAGEGDQEPESSGEGSPDGDSGEQ